MRSARRFEYAPDPDEVRRTGSGSGAIVELAEVKDHLRIDGTDDDADIERLIAIAEMAVERYLNRPVKPASFEALWRVAPAEDATIRLSAPSPISAVSAVEYAEGGGTAWTAVSDDKYSVDGLWTLPEPHSRPVIVKPGEDGWGWDDEIGEYRIHAVRVRVTAGWTENAAPAPIQHAVKMLISDAWNWQSDTIDLAQYGTRHGIRYHLAPYVLGSMVWQMGVRWQ